MTTSSTATETNLVKFQDLLRELFQFDCADLDFGIYRIMNHKRDVVEQFITRKVAKDRRCQRVGWRSHWLNRRRAERRSRGQLRLASSRKSLGSKRHRRRREPNRWRFPLLSTPIGQRIS